MLILVSTKAGQKLRPGDFCWVAEGEPVVLGFECDGEAVNGKCGCRRSMVGISDRRATTTFTVFDRPDLDEAGFVALIKPGVERAGFKAGQVDSEVSYQIRFIKAVTADFVPGIVLERRGRIVRIRFGVDGRPVRVPIIVSVLATVDAEDRAAYAATGSTQGLKP